MHYDTLCQLPDVFVLWLAHFCTPHRPGAMYATSHSLTYVYDGLHILCVYIVCVCVSACLSVFRRKNEHDKVHVVSWSLEGLSTNIR